MAKEPKEQAPAEQAPAEAGMTAEEAQAALEKPGVSYTLGELQRLEAIARG